MKEKILMVSESKFTNIKQLGSSNLTSTYLYRPTFRSRLKLVDSGVRPGQQVWTEPRHLHRQI